MYLSRERCEQVARECEAHFADLDENIAYLQALLQWDPARQGTRRVKLQAKLDNPLVNKDHPKESKLSHDSPKSEEVTTSSRCLLETSHCQKSKTNQRHS